MHCRPISAPIPRGVDISYVELADDMRFFEFTRISDVDSGSNVGTIKEFMTTLSRVVKDLKSDIKNSMNGVSIGNSSMPCSAIEVAKGQCVAHAPSFKDEDEDGGGIAEGPDDGGWSEGGEGGNDDFPEGAPTEVPEGLENAGSGDGCIMTPIAMICTTNGQRPPPVDPYNPPLPGSTPWFPQSWCDFSSIFCSEGQEPRDNNRGADSEHSGKTLDQLTAICYANLETDQAVCEANFKMHRDSGVLRACNENAWNRLHACVKTAKKVTGNGAYPAP